MICFVHPSKEPLVLTIFLLRPCFGNLLKKDLFCQPAQPSPCSVPTFSTEGRLCQLYGQKASSCLATCPAVAETSLCLSQCLNSCAPPVNNSIVQFFCRPLWAVRKLLSARSTNNDTHTCIDSAEITSFQSSVISQPPPYLCKLPVTWDGWLWAV